MKYFVSFLIKALEKQLGEVLSEIEKKELNLDEFHTLWVGSAYEE